MNVTILVDNHVLNSCNLYGQPGFSCYIEDGGKTILFDTGFDDLFIRNAEILGIDLCKLDFVVISHGHDDHIGGLYHLIDYYKKREIKHRPSLIMHTFALHPKVWKDENIGSLIDEKNLTDFFNLILTDKTYHLTDNLIFLGEIPRHYSFEGIKPESLSRIRINGEVIQDQFLDDTALSYQTEDGIVIITGCSHSGICNITRYALELSGQQKVLDIIGGFHLFELSEDHKEGLLTFFSQCTIDEFHPCHCTSLENKILLNSVAPISEAGVGYCREY